MSMLFVLRSSSRAPSWDSWRRTAPVRPSSARVRLRSAFRVCSYWESSEAQGRAPGCRGQVWGEGHLRPRCLWWSLHPKNVRCSLLWDLWRHCWSVRFRSHRLRPQVQLYQPVEAPLHSWGGDARARVHQPYSCLCSQDFRYGSGSVEDGVGHVEKFTDLMVKDVKTGDCYRADISLWDMRRGWVFLMHVQVVGEQDRRAPQGHHSHGGAEKGAWAHSVCWSVAGVEGVAFRLIPTLLRSWRSSSSDSRSRPPSLATTSPSPTPSTSCLLPTLVLRVTALYGLRWGCDV